MIDKVNDEFIVDCTNNSKEERQQVYKFLVGKRSYSQSYLYNDVPIIVCNKKPGDSNWLSLENYYNWFNSKKDLPIYTFEQFKEMYLEEEFVLPEKWFIKITDENKEVLNEWKRNTKFKQTITEKESFVVEDGGMYGTKYWSDNKTEITFEQFKKYVLKQETMEKEIIGYKTPYNMYGGQVKKGDIWTLNKYDNGYQSNANVTDLPKEIVEQWEKVYKEEKTIVKMYSSNKGEFEIEVVGKKAYYRPEHKELSLQFIKNILNLFENKTIGLEYSIEVDSLKVGCMEGTRKSDWQKVYDLIK